MTAAKKAPWWQSFQVIAYICAGLTAIGTGVVVLNKYLTLPDRVEAGEQKNQQQDKILDRVTAVLEYQQQIAQSNQPKSQVIKETDKDGTWCCYEGDSQACWDNHTWKQC